MDFKELTRHCLSCSIGKMTKTAFKNILVGYEKTRKYIPVQEKMTIAMYCKNLWESEMGNTDEQQVLSLMDGSLEAKIGGYDRAVLLYTWIKTCVIVCDYFDIDYDFEEVSTVVYDSFFESGLIDYLNEVTNGDFKEFDKYVDWFSGISYYPLLDIVKKTMLNLPSKEELQGAMAQISESKEAMANIKEIIKLIQPEEKDK